MPNPNYAINQIFTVKVIDELISNHNCEVYDYIVQKTIAQGPLTHLIMKYNVINNSI